MTQPHPTNTGVFRPTPPDWKLVEPTHGELRAYQDGVMRFPQLAIGGGFRVWPLQNLYPGVIIEHTVFNCFGWAAGHTDRWLEGGTVPVMNRLFRKYHFHECGPDVADVALYKILDAPAMIPNARGIMLPNPKANVQHAHRRDRDSVGRMFQCSSKLQKGPLIAHNELGLQDGRPWGSISPAISYGSIYQYWRRNPDHPAFPGNEHNLVPRTGHYPESSIYEGGWLKYPPGHPGNDIPPGEPDSDDGGSSTGLTYRSANHHQGRHGKPHKQELPRGSHSPFVPRRQFAKVSQMRPYDPIPPPSRAAYDMAVQNFKRMNKAAPRLVKAFMHMFQSWKMTWSSCNSSNARPRCYVPEFDRLVEMGSQIIPLVVYMLLSSDNFTAVFLYNTLEKNTKYLIDPEDVLNFLVLQRQNNLIVEINQGRKC